MATSSEIKQRAKALAEKTDVNSITPREVGGIMYDLASHSENVLRNGGTLGIRKVYESVAAMEADSTNPKDLWGEPLKKGNLVVIYDGTSTGVDNNKIYAFLKPGWQIATHLDAGYVTRSELNSKIVQETGEGENVVMSQKAVTEELGKTSHLERGVNLFDKARVKTGYSISNDTYKELDKYAVTHPIFVKKGVKYKYGKASNLGGDVSALEVNCDGSVIKKFNVESLGNDYFAFTASNDGYVSVNVGDWDGINAFMFCEFDNYPQTYVSYESTLKEIFIPKQADIDEKCTAYTDNALFNSIIKEIYAPSLDVSKVSSVQIICGEFNGETYRNYVSFHDSINRTLLQYEKLCASLEEAISSFDGIIGTSTNSFVMLVDNKKSIKIKMPVRFIRTPKSLSIENYLKGFMIDENRKLIDGFTSKSVNLFNGKTLGGFWNGNSFLASDTYFATEPIQVEVGKTYKYKAPKDTFGANAYYVAQYNDKKVLSGFVLSEESEGGYGNVTIKADVSYISVNIGVKSHIDNFMVCEQNLYPENFVPYTDILNEKIKVPASSIMGDVNIDQESASVLKGKIVSFNGDSICEGAGSSGGYGKIIATRNEMIYQNVGVSGGTVTAEQYFSSNGLPRHWICRSISSMRSDADYIILEGGVNDSSIQVPLGEISVKYNRALDDTTFCGAMESTFKQALERFKGKKIGFLIVHKMTETYSSEYPEYEYYEKTKRICEKWGIPYLDLNVECPPLGYIESLKQEYTSNGDGWHPNEEGYKKYYCDKIESWMKTL